MIESARQALAFAEGEPGHGCVMHAPAQIEVEEKAPARTSQPVQD